MEAIKKQKKEMLSDLSKTDSHKESQKQSIWKTFYLVAAMVNFMCQLG